MGRGGEGRGGRGGRGLRPRGGGGRGIPLHCDGAFCALTTGVTPILRSIAMRLMQKEM